MTRTLLFLILMSSRAFASVLFPDELAPRLQIILAERLPSHAKISVRNIRTNRPVPQGAKLHLNSDAPVGVISFTSESDSGTIYGSAEVSATARIAVARVPLSNGDTFDDKNISFEERQLAPLLSSGYFADWDSLSTRQAKGYIRPNTVISAMNVQTPYTVSQGQFVELEFQKGALVISARVKAMENGNRGQWIRVQNPSTQKIVTAKVTGAGTVAVR